MGAIKSILNHTLLFVAGTMLLIAFPAQTGTAGADSVAFVRAKFAFDKFTFSDGGTREIRIKDDGTKLVKDKGKVVMRDAGNGLLTLITGVGMGSSAIISDGRQNKSWVFYNNKYLFMLHAGNQMNHIRKGVTDPYLLIKNIESGPDRRDLFRLAMVCRYLNSALGK